MLLLTENRPDEPFLLLIRSISEYFLFRMLLRLDISPYFLILTTVTTTYKKPVGRRRFLVETKQASKSQDGAALIPEEI